MIEYHNIQVIQNKAKFSQKLFQILLLTKNVIYTKKIIIITLYIFKKITSRFIFQKLNLRIKFQILT